MLSVNINSSIISVLDITIKYKPAEAGFAYRDACEADGHILYIDAFD